MKIKEFIEKVNDHDEMRAKKTAEGIVIGTPNNMGIFNIPEDATNFIEIDTWATSNSLYWKKPDREYLSALIEEFMHTPIKERFPEKKYYLLANPDAMEKFGTNDAKYVSSIDAGADYVALNYGPATKWSEDDLKGIESLAPYLTPAIDAMKEPVEEE